MTGKRLWSIILLIPLFMGCRDQKENIMDITQEEASALITRLFPTQCVAAKTDMASGLAFNTLTRIPGNKPEDKWTTLPDRDIISVAADAAESKKIQIRYLVDQGVMEKISDVIYLGRGAIRGYYHKPVDYKKGENKGEWTFEDKGHQYRLTKKGYAMISQKSRPALAFCLGDIVLGQPIIYRQPERYTDKVKVIFTTSLENTPAWVTDATTRSMFPYVAQQWKRKKAPGRYKVYIKILNGQYVIENEQFIPLD